MGCRGRREGAPDLAPSVHLTSAWTRDRRCQGWQALRWEHSQGVINNLLSQGGLLDFRITRHRRRAAQMDPPIPTFYIDRDNCEAGWGLQPELGAFRPRRAARPHPDSHCTQRGCRVRTGAAMSPKYESCPEGFKQGGLRQRHPALISFARM